MKNNRATKWLTSIRKRFHLETIGLAVPPFTASFKLSRKGVAPKCRRVVAHPIIQTFSPITSVLDTVDAMAELERKKAIRNGDWVSAIFAAAVQGYAKQAKSSTLRGSQ